MAAYFSQYDSHLPPLIANDSDIADLASEAEAAVIAHYRRRVPDRRGTVQADSRVHLETGSENLTESAGTTKVYLLYYETDADDVDTTDTDESAFLSAMRRAIAEQVKFLFYQREQNPTLQSQTRGERSETYFQSSQGAGIAPKVEFWLAPFDIRPATYAL